MAGEGDAMSRIKTVVVLVQENHSFDNMLGWMMQSVNPKIDGVTGRESNPLSTSNANSGLVYFGDKAEYVDPDPGHSIQAIYEQVYGVPFVSSEQTPITPPDVPVPPMNGFAQNADKTQQGMAETVMNGFLPGALPVYEALVKEFAVCDRWFASVPASTQPNRQYVHSATSHGLTSNDTKLLVEGMPQKTIFDSLYDAGFSFGIYYQQPPATLFYRNLRQLKYIGNFREFSLTFMDDCKNGKLPNYTVIEQRWFPLIVPANDDHPPHDVLDGQKLIKDIYEALRSSPQWNEMLFIITYDERGGFYDHVPTPVGVPSPDGVVGPEPFYFNFDRLGVRVPALLISPWIEPGTVLHKPSGPTPSSEFEHSSIPATVKKIFKLDEFLTKRDAWAGTFETVLTRTTPRTDCPETMPELAKLREHVDPNHAKLSEFQEELVQLGAVLNGDWTKEEYPDKLVEGMTVAEAGTYVENALKTFWEECERCRQEGKDGSYVVVVKPKEEAEASLERKTSFAQKMFSCLGCSQS